MWNTELIIDTLTTITANYAPVGGGILVLGSEKGIIISPPYAGGSPWLSYDTIPGPLLEDRLESDMEFSQFLSVLQLKTTSSQRSLERCSSPILCLRSCIDRNEPEMLGLPAVPPVSQANTESNLRAIKAHVLNNYASTEPDVADSGVVGTWWGVCEPHDSDGFRTLIGGGSQGFVSDDDDEDKIDTEKYTVTLEVCHHRSNRRWLRLR